MSTCGNAFVVDVMVIAEIVCIKKRGVANVVVHGGGDVGLT